VILSARRVAPGGFAYGLDMTDEMLAIAEAERGPRQRAERQVPEGHIRVDPVAGPTASTS